MRTGRISLEYKGKNDPVTQADADAQQMIRQTIRRRFPDDDFLGEEDAGARLRDLAPPVKVADGCRTDRRHDELRHVACRCSAPRSH